MQGYRSKAISIDAPIDGWDAFNSMDNMPPTAAIILENLIPSTGSVITRGGTLQYEDLGTAQPVETVASLDADIGSLLIAASDGGVWGMSDAPVMVRAASITQIAPASTFTNSRWQTQNFRKADESGVLIMCNGVDDAQVIVSPYGTGDIKDLLFNQTEGGALVARQFIGVCNFKGRCYYWDDDSDSFWYCQAGSYQGLIQEFNLGAIAQLGGKLMFITTWTQKDSGDGKDDFIVFVMSTGEILIYQGDDPQSIGFFEMVGRYTTASPLSVRGHSKYGADTVIMTTDGYISLSTIIQEGRVSDVPAFSRLIINAISEATRYGSEWYGWDCELLAKQSLFVFNVPLTDSNNASEQHVLNTVTQRWCKFTNITINCLAEHKNRLFGGGLDGKIIAISEGTSDLGQPILFTALPAFNYFGDQGNHKHITAAQIISTHSNPEYFELTGFADFNYRFPPYPDTPPTRESAIWSVNPPDPPAALGSFWDEDYWSVEGTQLTTKGWQNVSGFGYAVSVMVRFLKVNEGVIWRSTGIRFNQAGAQ